MILLQIHELCNEYLCTFFKRKMLEINENVLLLHKSKTSLFADYSFFIIH